MAAALRGPLLSPSSPAAPFCLHCRRQPLAVVALPRRAAPPHLLRPAAVAPAAAAEQQPSLDACPAVKPDLQWPLEQLDIRVGAVVEARCVEAQVGATRGTETRTRAKKLLQLEVDIGVEVRTITLDIYAVLDEESAVGKKVLLVANVPPTTVHGFPSHGTLLLGNNFDPTPMPRSFRQVLPTPGRLPPGSSYTFH